jgi:outer membrane lipoprotein LolB
LRVDGAADQASRQVNLSFDLRGSDAHGELRLSSVLGTQLASARWSPGEAVLQTAEGMRRFADLDALAREAFGETLPLRALPDWLAGRPWAGAASTAGADGFEQLGWHIVVSRLAAGWIEARRDQRPAASLRVRLDTVP